MTTLTASQISFIKSLKSQKTVPSSTLISRSNSLMFGAVVCWIIMICPTPNLLRITLAVGSVGFMQTAGRLLDQALYNDQTKIFDHYQKRS